MSELSMLVLMLLVSITSSIVAWTAAEHGRTGTALGLWVFGCVICGIALTNLQYVAPFAQ